MTTTDEDNAKTHGTRTSRLVQSRLTKLSLVVIAAVLVLCTYNMMSFIVDLFKRTLDANSVILTATNILFSISKV